MSLWSRFQRRLGDLAEDLILDEYRDQLNKSQDLLAKGETQQAIELLEALLVSKSEHGQALIVLGAAYLQARQPQKALDAFERSLKLRGGDPHALVGHGTALVALGRYDIAVASLGRAVQEAGGDRDVLASAYRGLGIAWRRRGDLDKAIRELRKAVVEDGDDMEARAALGEALIADGGPYDEALRHLERATGKSDEKPPVVGLYALGKLALIEGSPAIAGEQLARARAASDEDVSPFASQLRAEIMIALGDAALASSSSSADAMRAHGFFLEALQLDAKRAEVHARIAITHRTIGNLDAALQSYERALGLGAGVDVLRAAVDTAIAAGDATRELQWGNDLLATAPDDLRALVARGSAMLGDQPDAARALLEVAAAKDDVDAHAALARLTLATDPQKAATSALAALRVAPHHSKARQILTEARTAAFGTPGPEIADVATYIEKTVESRRELGHLVGEVARAAANLDQPLLVTVMGEFSSGKSSFVNAFIGADVAPTGITPTTATINVVRYGRERGGRIVARDGSTTELGWDGLMAHMKALTPDAAKAIDRVEILVPLPQLEKINIVDTPGLNSIQPEHEATARAFIGKADAIVWVFTAAQGGKASEKKALRSIREEGKRVLGVLNKADQLTPEETKEVTAFIGGELDDLVEAIVPFSARKALAWKQKDRPTGMEDGNWSGLLGNLEERFFQQARQLKRDACARLLRGVVAEAQRTIESSRLRASEAADAARGGRDELIASARKFGEASVLAERKALSEQMTALYRRAAREVIELVRPRRLPFSSHSATVADRDYLIALLSSGFETAVENGRQRVAVDLLARSKSAEAAARILTSALEVDVLGDLHRTADDRIGLALSRVFDRARAYTRGYVEGGYVEAFFRNDVPRLELAEDAVYHALVRGAPDLDRELAEPLTRAASDALAALAGRLDHWGAVVDVHAFDLEVGIARALELAAARL
jgi:tetratricopeptide (TPR) repeat protein/GTP-binding protein EngB required for normal cell division